MIPERFKGALRVPEHHLHGIRSLRFSTIRIVASYGWRAKGIQGYCSTDLETRESTIVLKPNAGPGVLGHEVGHHILGSGQVTTSEFGQIASDWKVALSLDEEILFGCDLLDEEEFFADLYALWSSTTEQSTKARVVLREVLPNASLILDKLYRR